MTEPTTKQTKYDLEKDFKEKLRLFLMSVRPILSPPIAVEKLVGIVGYRERDAMMKAQKEYATPGLKIAYNAGDSILIEDLMRTIKLEGVTIAESPVETTINMPIKPTKEQFVNNLKLFADDFVDDEEDRKVLKKIINKI